MRLHLRFDHFNSRYTHMTLFVNASNCGSLTFLNEEAIWFDHILERGCLAISPAGTLLVEYVASGHPPDPTAAAMDAVVQATPKGYP